MVIAVVVVVVGRFFLPITRDMVEWFFESRWTPFVFCAPIPLLFFVEFGMCTIVSSIEECIL